MTIQGARLLLETHQRQQDRLWNTRRDRPHPYRASISGTQCDFCWGWIDDPRHTDRI